MNYIRQTQHFWNYLTSIITYFMSISANTTPRRPHRGQHCFPNFCEIAERDTVVSSRLNLTLQMRGFANYYHMTSYYEVNTVYPKKYADGFVVLCFVVVMQSFIMNSYEVFIHIHQGCFAGTGAIVRLPQCQWSKPDGYGKISQCITTTKHS